MRLLRYLRDEASLGEKIHFVLCVVWTLQMILVAVIVGLQDLLLLYVTEISLVALILTSVLAFQEAKHDKEAANADPKRENK